MAVLGAGPGTIVKVLRRAEAGVAGHLFQALDDDV
jgi:hypothetical protein